MKRTYILVLGLMALMTGCSKVDTIKSSIAKTESVPVATPVPAPRPESDFMKTLRESSERFKSEITQPGDCWALEYHQDPKASFLKEGTFKSQAHILMAKDKGLVLFGQPEPDCQESFDKSSKCSYWIRTMPETEMSTFFNTNHKKVACPAGLNIKSLVDKASSSDKETIDFSKVVLK